LVGDVGFDPSIPDIAFDRDGNRYGLTGSQGNNAGSLILSTLQLVPARSLARPLHWFTRSKIS